MNGLNVLNGCLSPFIHRYGFLIVAIHDPPVAVGFAADDDDMDFFRFEHVDHFVRGGFQLRRVGFFAEGGARQDVILDQLIIPIFFGRHERIFIGPVDQFLLGIEAAAVDELARGDRIEQEGRLAVRVQAAQHAAHMLAPDISRARRG